MKALLDVLGVIWFVLVYRHSGILIAIEWTLIYYLLQTLILIAVTRKIDYVQLAITGIVVALGFLSLKAQNALWFKWKPTLIYWLFAIGLITPRFIPRLKDIIILKKLLGSQMNLPDPIWWRLTWSWISFFFMIGIVNLGVAYFFDTSVWVYFKLFGITGLLLIFIVGQMLWCAKYLEPR